jgi:hypothetical protein
MEKENKKAADKHIKKERARIIKLVELAYKNDPRVRRVREQEELEKQKKKQEIKERKDRERKEIEDRQRAIEEAKQRELEAKAEEEKRIRDEKAKEVARRKEAVKKLSQICEERAPGTRYDRYFFEEFTKKLKTTEAIEEMTEKLMSSENLSGPLFVEEIEKLVGVHQNQHEQARISGKKEEKQKQEEESKKGEWTMEELSNLSKAIVKYPGAIPNRWKVITEYIGTDKTQK